MSHIPSLTIAFYQIVSLITCWTRVSSPPNQKFTKSLKQPKNKYYSNNTTLILGFTNNSLIPLSCTNVSNSHRIQLLSFHLSHNSLFPLQAPTPFKTVMVGFTRFGETVFLRSPPPLSKNNTRATPLRKEWEPLAFAWTFSRVLGNLETLQLNVGETGKPRSPGAFEYIQISFRKPHDAF